MKKTFLPFVNRRYAHVFGDAGEFDASEHQNFLLKAEEVWEDGKFQDDFVAHVDTVKKQLEVQTARFSELDDPEKDNTVTVAWINACGITDEAHDAADICELEGVEMETTSQEYEMDLTRRASFSINERKMRTNIYSKEEQVARGLLRLDKALSEYWNKQTLLFYKNSAGINVPVKQQPGLSAPFTWNNAATTTNVPGSNYDVSIISKLIMQMQLNMINNGFFVDSGYLFDSWTNAGLDKDNLDGKGDDARSKKIDLEFDMWGFLAAGLTENMFLLDRSAVALKTYNEYMPLSNKSVIGGKVNQTRYAWPSKVLPGVSYDLIYEMTCVGGAIIHTFTMFTKGGLFLNPTPCPITIDGTPYTPTGVISYTATA